jgi:hypothetical protein
MRRRRLFRSNGVEHYEEWRPSESGENRNVASLENLTNVVELLHTGGISSSSLVRFRLHHARALELDSFRFTA